VKKSCIGCGSSACVTAEDESPFEFGRLYLYILYSLVINLCIVITHCFICLVGVRIKTAGGRANPKNAVVAEMVARELVNICFVCHSCVITATV
jgi:hypothetical protein